MFYKPEAQVHCHFLSSEKIINYFLLAGITIALDVHDCYTGDSFFPKHQVAASFNFLFKFTH